MKNKEIKVIKKDSSKFGGRLVAIVDNEEVGFLRYHIEPEKVVNISIVEVKYNYEVDEIVRRLIVELKKLEFKMIICRSVMNEIIMSIIVDEGIYLKK